MQAVQFANVAAIMLFISTWIASRHGKID